jgi:hypothetical protein
LLQTFAAILVAILVIAFCFILYIAALLRYSLSLFQRSLMSLGFILLAFESGGGVIAVGMKNREFFLAFSLVVLFIVSPFLTISSLLHEWVVVKKMVRFNKLAKEAERGGDIDRIALYERKQQRCRRRIIGRVKEIEDLEAGYK